MISFGASKQESRPERVEVWTPEQKQLFAALQPIIRQGLGRPVPAYPGQMYVPRLPEEEAYFRAVSTLYPAYQEASPARQAALQTVLGGRPPYEVGPEWAEQYSSKPSDLLI